MPAFVFLNVSEDNNPILKTKADMSRVAPVAQDLWNATNCIFSDLIWTGSAIPTVALWSWCQDVQARESLLQNEL